MTEEYLANPPFLSLGMAAAMKHVLTGYLDVDATLVLGEEVMAALHDMVAAKEPFDPQLEGINTPTELFVARTVYWAIQVLDTLPAEGLPEPVMVKTRTVKATSKRQKRAARAVLEWIAPGGLPVDSFERKDDATP